MAAGIATVGGGAGRGGVRFTFEVPGAQRVDVALSRFGEEITDWSDFFRDEAAPLLFDRIQRNFATKGGFTLGGWAPLSPRYAAWKAKHYPGQPLLVRQGSLLASLTWIAGHVGPRGIARIGKTQAEFGTSVPYGIYHQLGTFRMPQRQVIVPPESETWGRLLHRFVVAKQKAAALGQRTTEEPGTA